MVWEVKLTDGHTELVSGDTLVYPEDDDDSHWYFYEESELKAAYNSKYVICLRRRYDLEHRYED